MKLGALPIACQGAPEVTEIPVFPKKMEVENLASDSKVLLRVAEIHTDKKVLPVMKILQKNILVVFSIFSNRKHPCEFQSQELHI